MSTNTKVLVTGASGFIACHIIQKLIEKNYSVRGTVRSLKDETKVAPIRTLGTEENPIELVEADLTEEASWVPAVAGCKYVMHVASPIPSKNTKMAEELINPAVAGVVNVLKACTLDGGVKRIILTSSIAAINGVFGVRSDRKWTEEDWTDVTPLTGLEDAYTKSKTMAEQAAWDYVKDLPEGKKLELVVMNPAYVLGPLLSGPLATSPSMIKQMINREIRANINLGLAIIDVWDVADAHIAAIDCDQAVGHRHILAQDSLWMQEMAQVLSEEFNPQGYNVSTRVMPDFLVRFLSLFMSNLKFLSKGLGMMAEFDSGRMKNVLNVPGRDVKACLLDTAYSLIEAGHVPKTDKYNGPKYSDQ